MNEPSCINLDRKAVGESSIGEPVQCLVAFELWVSYGSTSDRVFGESYVAICSRPLLRSYFFGFLTSEFVKGLRIHCRFLVL